MSLRFRRSPRGSTPPTKLHDPPALAAAPRKLLIASSFFLIIIRFFSGDIVAALLSVPRLLPDILPAFVPYALVLAVFAAFVLWNGGIVLGRCIACLLFGD